MDGYQHDIWSRQGAQTRGTEPLMLTGQKCREVSPWVLVYGFDDSEAAASCGECMASDSNSKASTLAPHT